MTARLALHRGLIYLLPLALLFGTLIARVVAADELERLSLFCFDLYQKAVPREAGDAPIRVVDIDDNSLKKIGQWPWPRTVVAQLVDRLRGAGAAVIAFDIDFAEPDRTSPKWLLQELEQNGVGQTEAERLLTALPDPDQRLAQAMAALPVVTGFILTDHGQSRPTLSKAGFALPGTTRSATSTASRRQFRTGRNWRRRAPEMGSSINLSIGTILCAGFR